MPPAMRPTNTSAGQPAAGDGRSDECEHEQGAGRKSVGRDAVLQDGARRTARICRTTSLSHEPDPDERDHAEDDPHPGAVGEGLREDAPWPRGPRA